MYVRIALGLVLLLRFVTVRGKIVRCSVGGVNDVNCDELIQDSVLQKYYIFSFLVPTNKIDDELDIPFKDFNKSDVNSLPRSKSFISQGLNSLKAFVGISDETSSSSENIMTRNKILKPITLYNVELSKSFNDAVLQGTDVYRLKFHSYITKLYAKDRLHSEQDYEVFLCSCYSAASIYFFTKNYNYAWHVLEDGIILIASLLKKSQNMISKQFKRELLVWSVVYQTMKVDLMNYLSFDEQQIVDAENELTEKMNELSNGPLKTYPSQYLLLYRRYFLDVDFDNEKKKKLIEVKKNDLIIAKVHDVYMNTHTYHYLTLAEKNANDHENAFMNLVNAILIPAFSVEGRLLNYKANQLAYNLVEDCIDDDGWMDKDENHLCTKIAKLRNEHLVIEEILIKYTHMKMYDYKSIITRLKENLNDDIINEDLLYNIVTSVIDMDVYDTDVYNAKIKNVDDAIYLLELFISNQNLKKKKQQMTEDEIQEIIKAYTWLAELNAVRCTNTNTDTYQKKVIKALKAANLLLTSYHESTINKTTNITQTGVLTANFDDNSNHLKFLIAKHVCKTSLPYKRWENPNRNDGWNIGTEGLNTSINNWIFDKQLDCYNRIEIGVNSENRYIHRADALIITYRYWHYKRNLYAARKSIRDALALVVVTSEDRYRNKEAHELYSMFLLRENCGDIKNDSSYRSLPENEDDNDFYNV